MLFFLKLLTPIQVFCLFTSHLHVIKDGSKWTPVRQQDLLYALLVTHRIEPNKLVKTIWHGWNFSTANQDIANAAFLLATRRAKRSTSSERALRCRAAGRPDYWSAPKVKNFEIIVGPGLGTLKKPKYHYMVVGGLLVQELEPLKDLKAEKGWFFGQN